MGFVAFFFFTRPCKQWRQVLCYGTMLFQGDLGWHPSLTCHNTKGRLASRREISSVSCSFSKLNSRTVGAIENTSSREVFLEKDLYEEDRETSRKQSRAALSFPRMLLPHRTAPMNGKTEAFQQKRSVEFNKCNICSSTAFIILSLFAYKRQSSRLRSSFMSDKYSYMRLTIE